MTEENNRPCRQCGAEPGERHREWDDLARCRSTGQQLIQCEGQFHEFGGREYGEHEGPCGPDIWDGEYPGVKECREYGIYTAPDSIWGVKEDLNTLAVTSTWDAENERYVLIDKPS
jgi:hypothetical protein